MGDRLYANSPVDHRLQFIRLLDSQARRRSDRDLGTPVGNSFDTAGNGFAMSSKFSGNTPLQKNFKVCKIPVANEELNRANFADYPLQAFASWRDPFSPLDAMISGYTVLRAIPELNLHAGRIEGTQHAIELDLICNPDTLRFTYIITLLLGNTVLEDRMLYFDEPQPQLPFSAGLFTFEETGSSATVKSKIYS